MTKNTIKAPLQNLKEHGLDAYESIAESSESIAKRGKSYARDHATPLILGAFALGLAFTSLLPRHNR